MFTLTNILIKFDSQKKIVSYSANSIWFFLSNLVKIVSHENKRINQDPWVQRMHKTYCPQRKEKMPEAGDFLKCRKLQKLSNLS